MKYSVILICAFLAAGAATPAAAALGDVVIPQPSQDGGFDSTYSPGTASIPIQSGATPGSGVVPAQTLVETDSNSTTGVSASWSPSFITSAPSSDMTLTFYNALPLSDVYWYNYDTNDSIPSPSLNVLFVVKVIDLASATVDKSFLVFPFSGVAYQMAGAPASGSIPCYLSCTTVGQMPASFWGRRTAQTENSSHDESIFFGGPEANNASDFVANPVWSGLAGFFPMGRLYQSQDKNFTYSMDLGPVPALKQIQVDSYVVYTRSDYPTPDLAPYLTYKAGALTVPFVAKIGSNTSGSAAGSSPYTGNVVSSGISGTYSRQPVSFYYVFNPTSGAATGYSVPSYSTPVALDPTSSKITTSDAPDVPYAASPAATVPAGLASTGDGCSAATVNMPAMYAGVSDAFNVLVMPGPSASNQNNYVLCTVTGYSTSVMSGYSVTGGQLNLSYSSTASGLAKTGATSNASTSIALTSAKATGSVSAGFGYILNATLSWTGTVTSGASTVQACYLKTNGGAPAGPYSPNSSATIQVGLTNGAITHFDYELDCTTPTGASQAFFELTSDNAGMCSNSSFGTPTAIKPSFPGSYPNC